MLVLSRKSAEQIQIGEDVVVTVVEIQGNCVRIGIDAPDEIRIRRMELPNGPSQATQDNSLATVVVPEVSPDPCNN